MILSLSIPDGAKCLLKQGQTVDFNSPFLENKMTSEQTIAISKKLHIPSDKIFKYLKKFVGDTISQGEVIAEKKGLINNHIIVSQSAGVIKEINHYEGNVVIASSNSQSDQTKAYFKGEVVEIEKYQVKILVEEVQEYNLKLASDNFGGQIFYMKDSSKSISAMQTSKKIMVSESITSYLKAKAEALGMSGFVTLKNPPQDSDLPKAQIKNIDDFKKALHLNSPYCLIDKQYSKIYFYR